MITLIHYCWEVSQNFQRETNIFGVQLIENRTNFFPSNLWAQFDQISVDTDGASNLFLVQTLSPTNLFCEMNVNVTFLSGAVK